MEGLLIRNNAQILLFTTYKFPGGGGLSTYIEQTLIGLKRVGVSTSYLSFDTLPTYYNKFLRILFYFRKFLFPFFYILYLFFQKIIFTLVIFKRFLKEGWNLIHAQDPLAVVHSSFIKERFKIPIIFTMHGFFINETLAYFDKSKNTSIYPILSNIEKKAIMNSSKVIAVEKSRFQYLKKYRKDEIYLMENYIDTNLFKKEFISRNFFKEKYADCKNSLIIITPKRLTDVTNIEFIIKLAEKIKEQELSIRFFILGYGSKKNLLKNTISQRHLNDIIKILDFIPRTKMPFIFNSSDIILIPSKEKKGVLEGSSYAVLEAMACEKLVFLSNNEPFKSMIGDKKIAVLIDLAELDEVIRLIKRFQKDPESFLELGRRAREYVEKNHSLKSKIKELLTIYGN